MSRKFYDPNRALEMGTRMREIRTAHNLRQQDVAKKLKISASSYAKYERGDINISVDAMYRIAAALKVNPCLICGCSDDDTD
jgi:transcriptional regulator with XRE-family HTH domain